MVLNDPVVRWWLVLLPLELVMVLVGRLEHVGIAWFGECLKGELGALGVALLSDGGGHWRGYFEKHLPRAEDLVLGVDQARASERQPNVPVIL